MDFKNETPSKSKNLMNKVLSNPMNCDSPFRLLPNISTPPSSPSVFTQVSTPKTDKFKWTIDEISSLKPADIDEATISQHVSYHDPTIESLVQEKIDKFFKEKAIVPSPINQVQPLPLAMSPPRSHTSSQTVLTLPPVLPKHVEEILAPYFSYTPDEFDHDSSLYRRLFEFEGHSSPATSSPAPSTGLSPIQFSPEFNPHSPKTKLESTLEVPELRDCTLSPIGRSPLSRSACRLSFSAHMSVDASMVVPDVNKSLHVTTLEQETSFQPLEDGGPCDSLVNWDMEYKQVSILSRSPVSSPERIDSSNSDTPHSRIFTSQRKRLSDSFKDEEFDRDVEMAEDVIMKRVKNRLGEDVTDAGYHTGGATLCESSTHMFASTPTKNKY
ncbi:protein aurora borealis isoform X2 [Tribolium madens]|uniref:protein aurora borealis isoform X2 n=1 Tax=Tribolium madens TaxID=41895 RepID=UPI001CF74639|nr:protein aurora borealis isoform X2 [Tribolium madens]